MVKKNNNLVDVFNRVEAFKIVELIDGFLFVASSIKTLTAFCSPNVTKRQGIIRLNFDFGLTVVEDAIQDERKSFVNAILQGNYVALPKSIPPENSLDMILNGECVSPWLENFMLKLMNTYSLQRTDALSLIDGEDDKMIRSFRRVYGNRFQTIIVDRLLGMEFRGQYT